MLAPPANLRDLLEAQVEQTPDTDFLLLESGDRVFTYRQFDDEVNKAVAMLLELGVTKGDRVNLLLTNRAEYLISYFACFKIGAWAGPVNALLKPGEIAYIIGDCEAGTVVTQPDLLSHLDEARTQVKSLRNVIVAGDDDRWTVIDHELNPQPRTLNPKLRSDDEAVIIYTSGTTGKPKGVLLTHENLLSNAQQIAEWLRLTQDDRSLIVMPLFHVNALMTTTMAALWAGASIVLAPRFSASRFWETISRFGVTYFGSVATMLSMLNHKYPEGVREGCDLSMVRFALCGSAPVPVEVLKSFESLFRFPVIEGYGLSESTCRATFNPIDEPRAGSVGKPIGNEIRVVDENDCEVAARQVGEIVLRGPNVMKSYFKNEAATSESFRSGWFHTGDLGYCDEQGFFYVVERKSDMIIRAGENIYPREIDEVLYQHPGVKDAATIGVPDELYGEEVKSFVVLREDEAITEQEIIDFCRQRLADFKCPKSVEFIDDIPKGPTGKLLKRELVRNDEC